MDNFNVWLAGSEDQNISTEYLDPLTVNEVEQKILTQILGVCHDAVTRFSIETKPGNPPGLYFKIALSFRFRQQYFKDAPFSQVKQFIQYLVDFFCYRHSENYISDGYNVDLEADTDNFIILIGFLEKS